MSHSHQFKRHNTLHWVVMSRLSKPFKNKNSVVKPCEAGWWKSTPWGTTIASVLAREAWNKILIRRLALKYAVVYVWQNPLICLLCNIFLRQQEVNMVEAKGVALSVECVRKMQKALPSSHTQHLLNQRWWYKPVTPELRCGSWRIGESRSSSDGYQGQPLLPEVLSQRGWERMGGRGEVGGGVRNN